MWASKFTQLKRAKSAWRRGTDQMHIGLVLKRADESDNIVVAFQVVHDLDLPPHILHVLL